MKSRKQKFELKKKYSRSKKYHLSALHDAYTSQPPVDKIVQSFNEKFDILVLIDHATIPPNVKLKILIRQILEVLKQALGKRISQMIPMVVSRGSVSLSKKESSFKLEQKRLLNSTSSVHDLKFGLNLNSDHIFETIIKGPAGDSSEAKEFRDFWGEKSQLGGALEWGQICEFVNWKPSDLKQLNLADFRAITGRIIMYILTKKFNFQRKYIRITGNEMDRFLSPCKIPPPGYGTGEERLKEISIAFDGLSKKLRSLSSLPLAVAKIQGVSPCLRGTHPFPPRRSGNHHFSPHFFTDKLSCISFETPSTKSYLTPYIEPVNVVFGMEASGKWPNELEAFRKTKTAFYIEMSEQLAKQYGTRSKVHPNYLDVLSDEIVFRVQLSCNKELMLLRQTINEKGIVETIESEEANVLEKLTIHLPIISSAINGVHTRFFNYSFTCRLVKRWLSCHLLLDHVEEVALELIVAYLFTNPYPQITPISPLCGFIRFLKLMKSFNWKKRPLIINFNGELKQQDIDEINANFQVRRQSLPFLFIATQYDKFNSIWTKDKPTAPILRRIIFLSNRCYNYLQTQLNTVTKYDFLPLFHTNRDIFDITINLNKRIMPNFPLGLNFVKYKDVDSYDKPPKRRPNNLEGFPIVDFDPVKYYIRDLKANFDEFALIFHDHFGGLKIFLAWKPNALNPKPLLSHDVKYFKSTGTINKSGENNIVLDVEAVLRDLETLGKGLVTSISVNNVSNWSVR